ncbi:sensor histidine kinase [Mycetocola sp. JXN-3]|uniref:sensor histidine kinase n=1 Tax=Mycetocola sp. JXN-3 TaxID=2116510 RepID=UPI00165D1B83|nr:sensor histidine kinase [Mycetocola sp. JXN-3]
MKLRRGWDLAVSACMVLLILLAFVSVTHEGASRLDVGTRAVLIAVGLGALAAYYLLWARPRNESNAVGWGAAWVIPIGALLTFASPSMFTAQVILYPMIWEGNARPRRPLILSGIAAIAMTATSILGTEGPDWPGNALVIGAVSYAFNLAMGLWISGISRVSAENARLYDQLRLRQEEIAALNRDAGAMHERGRLSRDLHDTVAQTLTGVVMLSRSALRQAEAGSPKLVDTVRLIESSAAEALAETRAMVATASSLEESTFAETLERFCTRFARETGIAVDLEFSLDPGAVLSRAEEVILLRCVQEGLANVRKHSGANAAWVRVASGQASVRLGIADNGRGPITAAPEPHAPGEEAATAQPTGGQFGLAGLAERLGGVGGTVALTAGAEGGALLSVELPLSADPSTSPSLDPSTHLSTGPHPDPSIRPNFRPSAVPSTEEQS